MWMMNTSGNFVTGTLGFALNCYVDLFLDDVYVVLLGVYAH